MKGRTLIGLEPVYRIIELAIATTKLIGYRALSVMIIAHKESAKTEVVTKYGTNDAILLVTNFTPAAFYEQYIAKFSSGTYKILILPDLLNCISRQKYLVEGSITFLNALMEEGVTEIISKAFSKPIRLKNPARAGVITSIAKEDFDKRWHKWSSVGFLTRFLPVSFQYGQDTVKDILNNIAFKSEEQVLGKSIKLSLPAKKQKVEMPEELGQQLIDSIKPVQKSLHTYGFRMLRHLKRMCLAAALLDGKKVVEQKHVDEVLELAKFCNLDYTTIGDLDPPEWMNKPNRRDMELMGESE
ncbi:hypothetical protein ES703_04130 [subsurface metagenome]